MPVQSIPPAEPAEPFLQGSPVASSEGDLFSSGSFLKLGFSFVVGLAIGYALKVAFKIALVVVGVVLIALFSLQHGGIVDVNWMGLQARYDGLAAWVVAYAGALKDFMAANLASAASFSAGLLLGLRL